MSLQFIKYLHEDKDSRELVQEKLKFGKNELDPVMSEATIKYHFDGLAAKYVERYNKGEGDVDFNYGGAVLHNLFFANLIAPQAGNKPSGSSAELIENKYGTFEKFKEAVAKEFMAAQGSNWIYMDTSGALHTIHNHAYKKTMKIALIIDAWEHAWALDYQQNKVKYLDNIWRIINWPIVNDRLQGEV